MRRYAGVVVLCGLLAIPALVLARAPAPRVADLEASAAVAQRLLVKQYGADAKGIKGAKVKIAFLLTRPDPRSVNGKNRDLFAITAEEVSYSGDGLVTFKGARYVQHNYSPTVFHGQKYTGWTASHSEPAVLRFQFAGPVRCLQDIHKSQLKQFKVDNGTYGFDNTQVELVVE